MSKFLPVARGSVSDKLENQLSMLINSDLPTPEKVRIISDCIFHVRNEKEGFRAGVEFMNEFVSQVKP